jgi:hypothetical protein
MKPRLVFLLSTTVLALALGSLSAGCSWSVGGGKSTTSSKTPTHPPTRGQELIDLKKAHDAGALSDEEYASMKQRIMDQ